MEPTSSERDRLTGEEPPTNALLTDLYQLTMMQAYYAAEMTAPAVFEFFVRKLPPTRNFFLAAGLDQVLDYLEQLRFTDADMAWLRGLDRFSAAFLDRLRGVRFTGDVDALPEGTVFFPDEPVLRVVAPLPEAQLVETRVVNLLHLETLIASKAARLILAAPNKTLVDFGLRRAHGAEAGLLAARPPQSVQAQYDAFLSSPLHMLGYHAVFMAATAAIVSRSISGGIEAACKVLMPLLSALMLLLAIYSMIEGNVAAAVRFLLHLHLQRVNPAAALDALGLGFFSIGVGLGLMITYAAYSGAGVNLKEIVIVSGLADTAISFLAGLAVFPIVFAYGLDPASGPGLVFITLPLAFAQMPSGTLAAFGFFLLLFIAALASAISMLELVVALLTRRFELPRLKASAIAGSACFLLGIPTVLSFNVWADWHPLGSMAAFKSATVFALLDYLTSHILLPAGGSPSHCSPAGRYRTAC